MATSIYGKNENTYLQLKELIHAKNIKTIANCQYFEKTAGVQCLRKLTTIK